MASKEDSNDFKRLEHAWEWFKYHADQRYRSFNNFLIIIGTLATLTYVKFDIIKVPFSYLYLLLPVTAFVFYVLDIRNEFLVNNGKKELEKFQEILDVNIISRDVKGLPYVFFKHAFWIRFLIISVLIISLHIFFIQAKLVKVIPCCSVYYLFIYLILLIPSFFFELNSSVIYTDNKNGR